MSIVGDKNDLAFEVVRNADYNGWPSFRLSLFVDGKDILELNIDGTVHPYSWYTLDDIVEWFDESMDVITRPDPFPMDVPGSSGVEKQMRSYDDNLDDKYPIEMFERRNDWLWNHCWMRARAGSYLADIVFQEVNGRIELSWDNRQTYSNVQNCDLKFVHPCGCHLVEKKVFITLVHAFIQCYKNCRDNA